MLPQWLALILLVANAIISVFMFRHLFIADKNYDRGAAGFWLGLSLNAVYHMTQEVLK